MEYELISIKKLDTIEDTNSEIARRLHALLNSRHINRKSLNEIYELAELQAIQIAEVYDDAARNRKD